MTTKELEKRWQEFSVDGLDVQLEDGTSPRAWIEQGFGPRAFQRWFQAGGFDPERISELVEEGFDSEDVSDLVDAADEEDLNLSYSGYSIAYMYCNGDLTIEQVRRLVGNAAQLAASHSQNKTGVATASYTESKHPTEKIVNLQSTEQRSKTMDIETFQQGCLETFPGNVDFPKPEKCLTDYAEATLSEGTVTVELYDFGGCKGTGETVKEDFWRADTERHRIAEEQGFFSTGE